MKRIFSKISDRRFVAFVHFVPENISLGVTIDYLSPNLEIHLPFCFIKLGWQGIVNKNEGGVLDRHEFGIKYN